MATDLGDTAASVAAKPGETQTATIRYVDRPECTGDVRRSINHVYFDGQSLRIEFGITRLDEVKPNTPVTGRRYPAQRMVLTPGAAVELINRMQQVGAALAQAGVLKATPPKPTNAELKTPRLCIIPPRGPCGGRGRANLSRHESWRPRQDSNLRPLV